MSALDGLLMMPDNAHTLGGCDCDVVVDKLLARSFILRRYLLIHAALRSGISRHLVEGVL